MVVCGLLAKIKQLNHVEIHCMIIFYVHSKVVFFFLSVGSETPTF